MPDNPETNLGAEEEKRGSWRRKRKKRSLFARLAAVRASRKIDYLATLVMVLTLLVLVATGISDRIWGSIMSYFESSPPAP